MHQDATETAVGSPAAATVQVRPWQGDDPVAWEQYVLAHPHGTVFHSLRWSDAVRAAYGHAPVHLAAWRDGRLVGVLPLMLIRSLLAGRVLVSVPYATYGGILSDGPDVSAALLAEAQELCRRHRVRYLELRHREASGLELPQIGLYDTFRKELPADPDEVLAGLPRKARAAARKGISLLGPDAAQTGPQWLDPIWDLYSVNLRRLGSPNYSRTLFHALREAYGPDCVCMAVLHEGRPVTGVVSFRFRDELVPYFSGALPQSQELCANNLMYLRLMEHAVGDGLRWFDFNRTRRNNAGPYDFKRHHGFEPSPLHYQVYLHRARTLPSLNPSSRKFSLAVRLWPRLPLWFTRPAGARLTRWIP